ncbi:hypothetical protein PV327_002084 [Microctonus hyperodae]|uniref:Uncharacterized protein n=1 Tax=Microctonus hyperodae TaxID=165561 RepID=A0AA39FEX5_MICHY|nr:hypothetical protein PV327_002084 [Microctonus hyperodae]
MIRQSGRRVTCAFLTLIILVSAKPPPSSSPWATYGAGKPVYSKPLGPPGGLDTITVPYGPKASPFFPKFVDPKAMISSKTDYLNNLFGGLGPVNYPFASPTLYASNVETESPGDLSDLENIISFDKSDVKNSKRSMFGPMSGKFNPAASSFGSFAPTFGLSSPKFNFPFADSESKFGPSSRRKRSILTSEPAAPPINLGPPPPYPGLSTITEESDTETPTIPKQFLPGMFGPFGPFGFAPSSSIIDPSVFASKKTTFLNALFSNLATSTPATLSDVPTAKSTIVPPNFWSPVETATAIPVPKSTIVPPGFWAPSSIIPSPDEYTNKVSTFLDKLVESIKLNAIKAASNETATNDVPSPEPKSNFARSLIDSSVDKSKITNSIDDLATITAAKDAIVDSIIAELGTLKTDMINNLDELILVEQAEVAKASSSSSASKKPVKPFKAAFAGLWGPPPVDPTLPFKQKMTMLSGVFDMLTELQKNITIAVVDAIKNRATVTDSPPTSSILNPLNQITPETYNDYILSDSKTIAPFNVSFWDAIKSKLINPDALAQVNYGPEKYPSLPKASGAPFWSTYSQSGTFKRHVNDNDYDLYEDQRDSDDGKNNFKRAATMPMRQRYQNSPFESIGSMQADGDSVPGHQDGGIKFLSAENNNDDPWKEWIKWGEFIRDRYKDQHHHHNHH